MKNLWSEKEAKLFSKSDISLRVYSSRLLGQNPELVLHGGGNTSVKGKYKNIYEILRMFRSHGMVREVDDITIKEKYEQTYPELNPQFIFALPAFNVRNTEIGAILGRKQLKRLDHNNKKRTKNLILFLKNINKKYFRNEFILEGSSNYAFPLILNKPDFALRDKLEKNMKKNNIEFRRGNAGGGNQMRQPYLKGIVSEGEWENYPEVEHIHHFGWYIGNYPDLTEDRIIKLCKIINDV